MISIEKALETVLDQEILMPTQSKKPTECVGYYLGQDLQAPFDLPTFTNSAMDGYAVCGISSTYKVIGEVAAGDTHSSSLKEGEAIRIFTGGKVPENTTAVIMQEKVEVDGSVLIINDEVIGGKNIRLKGGELKNGTPVFEVGKLLSPATIGMISSLGFGEVGVFQKPKISILTTGNELIEQGTELNEGQIYESNGASLISALGNYGFSCQSKTQIEDDFEAIKSGISIELEKSNVVLISGGISVGEYDFVKRALEENGVEELFYKVAQKPGKPLYFGRKGEKLIFALPGNPASSLTCFYVYVLPLLQKISGGKEVGLHRMSVALDQDFEMKSDRPTFFKALVSNDEVKLLHGQGSSMLHSLAEGNALVFISEKRKYEKGEPVRCLLL